MKRRKLIIIGGFRHGHRTLLISSQSVLVSAQNQAQERKKGIARAATTVFTILPARFLPTALNSEMHGSA